MNDGTFPEINSLFPCFVSVSCTPAQVEHVPSSVVPQAPRATMSSQANALCLAPLAAPVPWEEAIRNSFREFHIALEQAQENKTCGRRRSRTWSPGDAVKENALPPRIDQAQTPLRMEHHMPDVCRTGSGLPSSPSASSDTRSMALANAIGDVLDGYLLMASSIRELIEQSKCSRVEDVMEDLVDVLENFRDSVLPQYAHHERLILYIVRVLEQVCLWLGVYITWRKLSVRPGLCESFLRLVASLQEKLSMLSDQFANDSFCPTVTLVWKAGRIQSNIVSDWPFGEETLSSLGMSEDDVSRCSHSSVYLARLAVLSWCSDSKSRQAFSQLADVPGIMTVSPFHHALSLMRKCHWGRALEVLSAACMSDDSSKVLPMCQYQLFLLAEEAEEACSTNLVCRSQRRSSVSEAAKTPSGRSLTPSSPVSPTSPRSPQSPTSPSRGLSSRLTVLASPHRLEDSILRFLWQFMKYSAVVAIMRSGPFARDAAVRQLAMRDIDDCGADKLVNDYVGAIGRIPIWAFVGETWSRVVELAQTMDVVGHLGDMLYTLRIQDDDPLIPLHLGLPVWIERILCSLSEHSGPQSWVNAAVRLWASEGVQHEPVVPPARHGAGTTSSGDAHPAPVDSPSPSAEMQSPPRLNRTSSTGRTHRTRDIVRTVALPSLLIRVAAYGLSFHQCLELARKWTVDVDGHHANGGMARGARRHRTHIALMLLRKSLELTCKSPTLDTPTTEVSGQHSLFAQPHETLIALATDDHSPSVSEARQTALSMYIHLSVSTNDLAVLHGLAEVLLNHAWNAKEIMAAGECLRYIVRKHGGAMSFIVRQVLQEHLLHLADACIHRVHASEGAVRWCVDVWYSSGVEVISSRVLDMINHLCRSRSSADVIDIAAPTLLALTDYVRQTTTAPPDLKVLVGRLYSTVTSCLTLENEQLQPLCARDPKFSRSVSALPLQCSCKLCLRLLSFLRSATEMVIDLTINPRECEHLHTQLGGVDGCRALSINATFGGFGQHRTVKIIKQEVTAERQQYLHATEKLTQNEAVMLRLQRAQQTAM